ncbi:insect cuticle protein domain-containing protein [Phthorimaea operculella]|nr:insect cuticle protein domain-containing protein [Phthorimaea operculella]
MRLVLVLLTLTWAQILNANPLVYSQPQQQVMHYDTADMPNSYNFHYTDASGATRTEQGSIKDRGTPQAALDVLGTVRWVDNKGQLYEMTYKAGKRGYRTSIKKIVVFSRYLQYKHHRLIMVALKLFVFGMLVAVGLAADADATDKPAVQIVTEITNVRQDGYDFKFETSDGASRQEEAMLITVGDHQGIGIKGSYAYTAPDGQQFQVDYTADEKGYNPIIKILNPTNQ